MTFDRQDNTIYKGGSIIVIEVILSYLISLAAGLRADAISRSRQEKLEQAVKKEAAALKAISNRQSLEEQLNLVGMEAARLRVREGVTKEEQPLFDLLADEIFRSDIARWLTVWKPVEKEEAQTKLARRMAAALKRTGTGETGIETFKAAYFDRIEKALFSDPVLSNWRFNLAFNTTFERLDELEAVTRKEGKQTRDKIKADIAHMMEQQARQQAGKFTAQQLDRARRRYREMALESCDIIDLSNLPEDRHTVTRTRELQLRRLYVPLRVRVEVEAGIEFDSEDLEKIEAMREQIRLGKAGRGKTPGDETEDDESKNRHAVGERLGRVNRMVILGDPGAGKTTLLRWVATAYLLRLKEDPAFKELPDVKTLPDRDWLPILIRCRDLAGACETGTLDDVLNETLRKAHLQDWETLALQAVMRERLVQGNAILMIDGLDEITNPRTRARFCEQIERLTMAFPKAPVIVTSRIVGYREMGYKIGRGFEHATVCDFSKEEKDAFARRWCEATEMPERSEKAAGELIRAIHSADRIERLTGNPMLLTTMALVKRKVGKLPKKRARLYWEAVQVLLNWRSEVDEPIDEDEALPQLEYIALEMSKRGKQRLRQDEIISLMDDVRREFPNLRPIKKHEPEEFLQLLERRTGIIIEAGEVMHNGRNKPVFEFRHLTFQEYLAALALIDGRFPGRDKHKSPAHYIAPLPGETEQGEVEITVTDNWREVLRLCVACCNDDDVDEVLKAILTPLETENPEETTRPRAILAASCLVDEPNVSDETAQIVLKRFVRQVTKGDYMGGILYLTAMDLVGSEWWGGLRHALAVEFYEREPLSRTYVGALFGNLIPASAPGEENELQLWLEKQVSDLSSRDDLIRIGAALSIMEMAFKEKTTVIPGMVEGLLKMLDSNGPPAHAGAWALRWLVNKNIWVPGKKETDQVITFAGNPSADMEAVFWSTGILEETKEPRAIEFLLSKLEDNRGRIMKMAVEVLGAIGDSRAVEPLLAKLEHENSDVRKAALGALAHIDENEQDRKLLSRYLDGKYSFLDPREPITNKQVESAAKKFKSSPATVRGRYETLAAKYGLQLEWTGD